MLHSNSTHIHLPYFIKWPHLVAGESEKYACILGDTYMGNTGGCHLKRKRGVDMEGPLAGSITVAIVGACLGKELLFY